MTGKCLKLLLLCLAACCAGCGSKSKFQFDALDVMPAQEELSEFSLGEFKVPIPIVDERGENQIRRNRFQFDFHLFALVAPREESQFAEAWERHEGTLRDQVIDICRNASVDDLQEPELATLKGRLTDALASQLGSRRLRQLLITDIVAQEL